LVVTEVTEAVSTALDELHFAMEALGDAVVSGKAPHTGDGLGPGAKGVSQGDERLEVTGGESLNEGKELAGQRAALPASAVLLVEEAEALLGFAFGKLVVDAFDGGAADVEDVG
jgi:hypothetical protein